MATVVNARKPLTTNPLKMSPALGAAMAFLGVDRTLPLFHGAQGCTAFALVLMVRHFREAIPLQTTALNEITTILGGLDNLGEACNTIKEKADPALIGICTTGLAETRGEDIRGFLPSLPETYPALRETALVYAETPDDLGGLQEGWGQAVAALIDTLAAADTPRDPGRVVLLPGAFMTPGDVEALRDLAELFGFDPVILPDLAGSLDGHVPDRWIPTSYGGTPLEAIRTLGGAAGALAFGEGMRPAAETLTARTGLPCPVLPAPVGLAGTDTLVKALMDLSGRPAPARVQRQRSQLVDAMLDAHFFFGGRRIGLAGEADQVAAVVPLLQDLGALAARVVTPTGPAGLKDLPVAEVVVGDLADLEAAAADLDLVITHAHGRGLAERHHVPLVRLGFPQFDTLGAAHQVSVGYRGSRDLVFTLGNTLMHAAHHAAHPLPEEPDHATPQTACG